eukprot:jgi/Mesvir1/4869/Mv25260-RA.1
MRQTALRQGSPSDSVQIITSRRSCCTTTALTAVGRTTSDEVGDRGRWVRNLVWGRRPNERRVPFDRTSDGRPVSRLLGPYSEEEVRAIPRVRTPVAATAEEREREAAAEAEREAEELPDA